MAAVNAEAAEGRGAPALGDAFQRMVQEIVQEALLAQERRMEERFRDLERTMQEDRQARANEGAEALTPGFEERLQRIEQRLQEIERRSLLSEGEERSQASAVEERLDRMESRMEQLDASTKRALQSVVPRVDVLLAQLETSSPPHPTSISASTSGDASAPPPPSSTSASSPAPRPRSSPAGSAATPLTPERRKELGNHLLDAASEGREDDVLRLLDEGADVSFSSRENGFTPLIYAVCVSHENIIALLIRMGADVNAANMDGDTALHFASIDHSGRYTSRLIRAEARVDTQNFHGETPLHVAAREGNEASARALLAAGASKSLRDNDGKTPSQYATTDNLRQFLRPCDERSFFNIF